MFVPSVNVQAEVIQIGPADDWFGFLSNDRLQPGDEVVLDTGVYSDARRLVIGLRGTADKPIVIRSGDEGGVTFRRPDAKQNSFNLEGCRFLELRVFEIVGGSSAIRIGPRGDIQSQDVTLSGLHIHHIGGVAVTCNHVGAKYQRMTFRQNHIHHTSGHGEAFYLGANDGKAIFSDSVIADNYIHDLAGPKVSQGDGIEIKQASYGNRITGNVIHNTNYPGVTVDGTSGKPRNVIEGNWIWETGDHGIQAAADAIIRGNVIRDAGGCGIYSRLHQGASPSGLLIEKNVVHSKRNPAIRLIGDPGKAKRIELLGNVFVGAENSLVVRIENIDLHAAQRNVGQGEFRGCPKAAEASPDQLRAPVQMKLPANHPAAEFFD